MIKTSSLLASLLTIILLLPTSCEGQPPFRIMTYNVENLFDAVDDPEINDEDFLPNSNRRWTQERYERKLIRIARVISSAGEWDTPSLVGLCEVENDSVMHRLLLHTPLRKYPYRYCLSALSDRRGIRVALVYRHDRFTLIGQSSIAVPIPRRSRPTRHILHAWGLTAGGDTLDVAVCHFPSMIAGGNSRYRTLAAETLNRLCDSITRVRSSPFIVVMGDFNAHPGSVYLKKAAGSTLCRISLADDSYGSYKYRGHWEEIDHIFVSCHMQNPQSRISVIPNSARSYQAPFLLTSRRSRSGPRPHRTYAGSYYEGGFSDHLPVVVDLRIGRGD